MEKRQSYSVAFEGPRGYVGVTACSHADAIILASAKRILCGLHTRCFRSINLDTGEEKQVNACHSISVHFV